MKSSLISLKTIIVGSLGLGLTLACAQTITASTVGAEYALVYAPPSNVRIEPNGRIICQVRVKKLITVYHFTTNNGGSPMDGWYTTNACGNDNMGVIHESQIKLTGRFHPAP